MEEYIGTIFTGAFIIGVYAVGILGGFFDGWTFRSSLLWPWHFLEIFLPRKWWIPIKRSADKMDD